MLEGVHCFASAADDGSLHVVRVHVTQGGNLPKYNKLQVIREHRVDHVGEYITCMTHYNTGTFPLSPCSLGCSHTVRHVIESCVHYDTLRHHDTRFTNHARPADDGES
jgi:hypothetical protein